MLIKDTNIWKGDHRSNTNVHHSIVAAVANLSIEHLVEGSKVGLLNAIHENSCEEDESAIVHLLVDHITDHGPLCVGAYIPASSVIARKVKNEQKSYSD